MAERKFPSGSTDVAAHNTWKYIRSNLLNILTIVSIILGISFGYILRNSADEQWSKREHVYVKFGGEIFMRMLKALFIPLILSSVIASLGSLNLRLSGKVGIRTLGFYLLTTICAVLLGIILVVTIHPGSHNKHDKLQTPSVIKPKKVLNEDVMMDIVRNMFPSNLFQATLYQYETILEVPTVVEIQHRIEKNQSIDDSELPIKSKYTDGTNTLGLLVFSTVFGIALSSIGPYGKPILKLVRCFSQTFMIVANWVLWLAPAGIFCLLAGSILEINDLDIALPKVKLYIITVVSGLFIHGLVVLPVIYFVLCGSHPFKVIGNVMYAIVTAFGTASSSATLPATITCAEDRIGVDSRVSRFVLPIGAAINMNGTALYEAVAAIFLVQLHGISLDLESIFAVGLLAIIGGFGTCGIPNAGIIMMTMLMNALGLPAETIAFLIPVDFIIHRLRTMVNVLGDAFGASYVYNVLEEELNNFPKDHLSKGLSTSTLDV